MCAEFKAEPVDLDGEDNHVHLLVNYPKVRSILTGQQPERRFRQTDHRAWVSRPATQALCGSLRSPNYFAGSYGGAPISVLRQYSETQRTPSLEGKDSGYGAPYILVPKDWGYGALDKCSGVPHLPVTIPVSS
ncbi:MAG: transposase [Desulfovibrio sp.]|nr:transposase [Desulfovibrio sp.]